MKAIEVKAKSTLIISYDDPTFDGRRPNAELYPVEKGDLIAIIHPGDIVAAASIAKKKEEDA